MAFGDKTKYEHQHSLMKLLDHRHHHGPVSNIAFCCNMGQGYQHGLQWHHRSLMLPWASTWPQATMLATGTSTSLAEIQAAYHCARPTHQSHTPLSIIFTTTKSLGAASFHHAWFISFLLSFLLLHHIYVCSRGIANSVC